MYRYRTCLFNAALILASGGATPAMAQSSGGPYRIHPYVIAGGGSPIAAGALQITSTIGQAATTTLAAGDYVLFDGFWSPLGGAPGNFLFANGFESNP